MWRDQDVEKAETFLDKTAVIDLARAIRRTGDAACAQALDIAFREFPSALEWIAQARARPTI